MPNVGNNATESIIITTNNNSEISEINEVNKVSEYNTENPFVEFIKYIGTDENIVVNKFTNNNKNIK